MNGLTEFERFNKCKHSKTIALTCDKNRSVLFFHFEDKKLSDFRCFAGIFVFVDIKDSKINFDEKVIIGETSDFSSINLTSKQHQNSCDLDLFIAFHEIPWEVDFRITVFNKLKASIKRRNPKCFQ